MFHDRDVFQGAYVIQSWAGSVSVSVQIQEDEGGILDVEKLGLYHS
jgi:hypothetical protein